MITSIIKAIKDLLLGKEVFIDDPRIGLLSERVLSKDPDKHYAWMSEHRLPDQNEKTTFIVDGNFEGPFPTQLHTIYRILDELKGIKEKTDKELRKNAAIPETLTTWPAEFYLSSLIPLDSETLEFELIFEAEDPEDMTYVSATWLNGKISEVELMA